MFSSPSDLLDGEGDGTIRDTELARIAQRLFDVASGLLSRKNNNVRLTPFSQSTPRLQFEREKSVRKAKGNERTQS